MFMFNFLLVKRNEQKNPVSSRGISFLLIACQSRTSKAAPNDSWSILSDNNKRRNR